MIVDIVNYIPEHGGGTSTVNHNVRYQITLDENECGNFDTLGLMSLESTNFTISGTFGADGNNHSLIKFDKCPFLSLALLDSWTWEIPGDIKQNVFYCNAVYISDPIYDASKSPLQEDTGSTYVIQRREVVAEKYYKEEGEETPTGVIQTTAGEKFVSPPPLTYENEIVFSIVRRFNVANKGDSTSPNIETTMLTYINEINLNKITINGYEVEAEHALVDNIQPTVKYYIERDGTTFTHKSYVEAVIKIVVKSTPHMLELLNAGFLELASTETGVKPTRIKTSEGNDIQSPQPIDKDGKAINTAVEYEPYYLQFRTNYARDFSYMKIPASFAPKLENEFYQ